MAIRVVQWTTGAATIAIADNESRAFQVSLPAQVIEGTPGTGTVSLAGTVVTALTVTLASNNPAQV